MVGPSGRDLSFLTPEERSMNVRIVSREDSVAPPTPPGPQRQQARKGNGASQGRQGLKHFMTPTTSIRLKKGTKTVLQFQGESVGPGQTPRRLQRPQTFPQQPDVSTLSMSCDPSSDYAVVVSMYEVYNDRIFDLLTPAVKSAATKEYRRRALMFKPTEGSPDRKAVAGLRKVICGSLHQALLVLEAGLQERRVTGTGSNSVSSRSHGFFCVEVKKRPKSSRRHGAEVPWSGSALTIVDLAGSERARDAKTAGATLAEAGKINESLMYLGQCLQMQSDANKDKPNLVPYRQCKLTELLFSNCYPSTSSFSSSTRRRNPQKAIMIVTADPHGDFNATSQILRYSALAREVTVPRVPSLPQPILTATSTSFLDSSALSSPTDVVTYPTLLSSPTITRTTSPTHKITTTKEPHHNYPTKSTGALEIAHLTSEVEYLQDALNQERAARQNAESHLLTVEDRMIELEQAVREDCTAEFEARLAAEMARWRETMQREMERGEEHWGGRLRFLSEYGENVLVESVVEENDRLRRENEMLRREVAAMSPTKRMPLRERGSVMGMGKSKVVAAPMETGSPRSRVARNGDRGEDDGGVRLKFEKLRVSDAQAPAARWPTGSVSPKKMRKLAAKRWNALGDDGDDMF
ncbi:hypothetical protein N0V88_004955 [Collariella sp. IMI 366227]|nr:hypothetical protein N0V88_004955 [Collariella sp. IMI 366227]